MLTRALIAITLTAIALSASGCRSKSSDQPRDPVASYQRFLDQEFERMKTERAPFALDSKYKLDVQKTDSLVSPLVGTCIVDVIYPWESEEHDIVLLFAINLHMKHGYQDGKWVLTTGRGRITGSKVLKDTSRHGVGVGAGKTMEGQSFEFESLDTLDTWKMTR